MKIPHPGELRHLVEIGRTVNAVNENGYPGDDSSRYFFATDAENAGRGLAFIIRWRADVQPGMWVKWNGEKQNITALGEYDFKRRYLKLTTESAKGVR